MTRCGTKTSRSWLGENMRGNHKHGDARHGRARATEYSIWSMMIQRCNNPNHPPYPSYGGRGISVCARWLKYEAFLEDVGRRPSPDLTLDRIDNNGNYEPGNIRWATRKEQARNRRSSHLITAFGTTATMAEWVDKTGINQGTLSSRLNRYGWTIERSLTCSR